MILKKMWREAEGLRPKVWSVGKRVKWVKAEVWDSLARKVQIGFLSFNVWEFVSYVLLCFKCLRMRHVAVQCKVKKRCAKCGGECDYSECGSNVKVKCCNCGGGHSTAFGRCQVQRVARQAQRDRISHDVSYAEAVDLLSGLVLLMVLAWTS
jgi:hypothetical protein